MTVIETTALQTAIEPYLSLGRSGLLPALHAAQKINGWISEPIATEIAKVTSHSACGCARSDRILFPLLQRTDQHAYHPCLYGCGVRDSKVGMRFCITFALIMDCNPVRRPKTCL